MSSYYLRAEAVNFDRFMLDTSDLSAVRGASYAVADAVKGIQQVLETAGARTVDAVSVGASIGLFAFDAEAGNVPAIVARVRAYLAGGGTTDLARALRHATFVVDAVAGSDPAVVTDPLLAANRWRQMTSATLVYPDTPAEVAAACVKDRVRPAVASGRRDEAGGVSRATADRREYGRRQKAGLIEQRLARPREISDLEPADDFAELTAHPDPSHPLHHRMAVILADGNGFGSVLRAVAHTKEERREFDRQLREAQSALMTRIVARCRGVDGVARVEPLRWAGDEFLLVVPAWRAWDVLVEVFSARPAFRPQARDGDAPPAEVPLSYGAGVVFCYYKTPIATATHLADALAEHAKEQLKKGSVVSSGAPRCPDGFAYEVLDSFDHVGPDLVAYRDRRKGAIPASALVLAGEGDLGDRLRDAAEVARTLGDEMPRRSLIRLAALHRDPEPSRERDRIQARTAVQLGTDAVARLERALGVRWDVHLAELLPYVVGAADGDQHARQGGEGVA